MTLNLRTEFHDELGHILDWMVVDPEAAAKLRAAPEQGLVTALAQDADRYFATANAQGGGPDDLDGREVVMTFREGPGGAMTHHRETSLEPDARGAVVAFWVKLTSAAALNREGRLMQHCVGSYAKKVEANHTTIYSLRDARNVPHVTVELTTNGGIAQIKGKQNHPPIARYVPFVKTFLNEMGVPAVGSGLGDVTRMGLAHNDGRYGTFDEVGIPAVTFMKFPSGDSIREVRIDQEAQGQGVQKTTRAYYVDKDGQMPLYVELSADHTVVGVTRTPGASSDDVVDNLIAYLNRKRARFTDHVLGGDLMNLGIVLNKSPQRLMRIRDAGRVVAERDGITMRVIDTYFYPMVLFFDAKGKQVCRVILRDHGPQLPWNETIPTGLVRALQDVLRDHYRNLNVSGDGLRRFGVSGMGRTPKTIFTAASGEIQNVDGRTLVFYDSAGALLGHATVHKDKTFDLSYETYRDLGNQNQGAASLVALLFEFTSRTEWRIVHYSGTVSQSLRQHGYAVYQNKIVPVDALAKTIKLRGGETYTESKEDGDPRIKATLARGEEVLAIGYIDSKGVVVEVDETSVDTLGVAAARLLNASGRKAARTNLLPWGVRWDGARFKALDPKKDKDLLAYRAQQVDLGNGYWFRVKHDSGGDILFSPSAAPGTAPWDAEPVWMVGRIELGDRDERNGNRGALGPNFNVRTARDLSQSGAQRGLLVKKSSKLLQFMHDRLEPFTVGDEGALVGPEGRATP